MPYLQTYKNLDPHFSHFLTDLAEIRYERSARNAVQDLWLSLKSAQGKNKIIRGLEL